MQHAVSSTHPFTTQNVVYACLLLYHQCIGKIKCCFGFAYFAIALPYCDLRLSYRYVSGVVRQEKE